MPQQRLGRVQWGDLTFGPGTPYAVTAVEGLDDLPDIRGEDVERPGQHGDYTGPDFTGPRTVQLGLGLHAASPDELRALTLALRNATQPQRQPAPLQFLDQGTLVYAKVRRRSIPYDAEYLWRTGSAALELYCADPYLYGLEEQSASTTTYSPAAGRSYPLTYGFTSVTLNTNSDFETTLAPWVGNTATAARVSTQAHSGSWSMQVTPNGTSATPRSESEKFPVSAGTKYRAQGWLRCVSARTLGLNVNWYDAASVYMTTSFNSQPVAANTWTFFNGAFTPPAGAAFAQLAATVNGTPPATDLLFGDELAFQQDFPTGVRAYGSAGDTGRVTAVNAGASDAFPVLRLDGPVSDPAIEQVTTGGILTLDADLQAGEYLLIDTRSRAVLFMGSSPRRTWVRAGSSWPVLQPGPNELAYRGSALPGAPGQESLLTITWRDTSL
ncbi:carbohydrate binding domain-containing protein [Streptomyces sp. NPDC046984]|uniref:carbohydrate binding domain-containing protein n=1 Tax=Streptomyces sp. NPDC046984 TaxID=3155138 RepID=UPI0033DD4C75